MKRSVTPSAPASSSSPSHHLAPTGSPSRIERPYGAYSSSSRSRRAAGCHFLVALRRYVDAARSSRYGGTSTLASHSDAADLNPSSPADADVFDSDSESQTEMDSSVDRHRCYRMPFPRSDALRVFCHTDNTFACPVYPAKRHRWTIMNEVKDHVLGMATSTPLRGENKKKWSCHRIVARNEGWME
uniref:Uncharacterized protein n=1 Tax=Setaria italica TaxID=4555 RepID=K4A2E4_SETIT